MSSGISLLLARSSPIPIPIPETVDRFRYLSDNLDVLAEMKRAREMGQQLNELIAIDDKITRRRTNEQLLRDVAESRPLPAAAESIFESETKDEYRLRPGRRTVWFARENGLDPKEVRWAPLSAWTEIRDGRVSLRSVGSSRDSVWHLVQVRVKEAEDDLFLEYTKKREHIETEFADYIRLLGASPPSGEIVAKIRRQLVDKLALYVANEEKKEKEKMTYRKAVDVKQRRLALYVRTDRTLADGALLSRIGPTFDTFSALWVDKNAASAQQTHVLYGPDGDAGKDPLTARLMDLFRTARAPSGGGEEEALAEASLCIWSTIVFDRTYGHTIRFELPERPLLYAEEDDTPLDASAWATDWRFDARQRIARAPAASAAGFRSPALANLTWIKANAGDALLPYDRFEWRSGTSFERGEFISTDRLAPAAARWTPGGGSPQTFTCWLVRESGDAVAYTPSEGARKSISGFVIRAPIVRLLVRHPAEEALALLPRSLGVSPAGLLTAEAVERAAAQALLAYGDGLRLISLEHGAAALPTIAKPLHLATVLVGEGSERIRRDEIRETIVRIDRDMSDFERALRQEEEEGRAKPGALAYSVRLFREDLTQIRQIAHENLLHLENEIRNLFRSPFDEADPRVHIHIFLMLRVIRSLDILQMEYAKKKTTTSERLLDALERQRDIIARYQIGEKEMTKLSSRNYSVLDLTRVLSRYSNEPSALLGIGAGAKKLSTQIDLEGTIDRRLTVTPIVRHYDALLDRARRRVEQVDPPENEINEEAEKKRREEATTTEKEAALESATTTEEEAVPSATRFYPANPLDDLENKLDEILKAESSPEDKVSSFKEWVKLVKSQLIQAQSATNAPSETIDTNLTRAAIQGMIVKSLYALFVSARNTRYYLGNTDLTTVSLATVSEQRRNNRRAIKKQLAALSNALRPQDARGRRLVYLNIEEAKTKIEPVIENLKKQKNTLAENIAAHLEAIVTGIIDPFISLGVPSPVQQEEPKQQTQLLSKSKKQKQKEKRQPPSTPVSTPPEARKKTRWQTLDTTQPGSPVKLIPTQPGSPVKLIFSKSIGNIGVHFRSAPELRQFIGKNPNAPALLQSAARRAFYDAAPDRPYLREYALTFWIWLGGSVLDPRYPLPVIRGPPDEDDPLFASYGRLGARTVRISFGWDSFDWTLVRDADAGVAYEPLLHGPLDAPTPYAVGWKTQEPANERVARLHREAGDLIEWTQAAERKRRELARRLLGALRSIAVDPSASTAAALPPAPAFASDREEGDDALLWQLHRKLGEVAFRGTSEMYRTERDYMDVLAERPDVRVGLELLVLCGGGGSYTSRYALPVAEEPEPGEDRFYASAESPLTRFSRPGLRMNEMADAFRPYRRRDCVLYLGRVRTREDARRFVEKCHSFDRRVECEFVREDPVDRTVLLRVQAPGSPETMRRGGGDGGGDRRAEGWIVALEREPPTVPQLTALASFAKRGIAGRANAWQLEDLARTADALAEMVNPLSHAHSLAQSDLRGTPASVPLYREIWHFDAFSLVPRESGRKRPMVELLYDVMLGLFGDAALQTLYDAAADEDTIRQQAKRTFLRVVRSLRFEPLHIASW